MNNSEVIIELFTKDKNIQVLAFNTHTDKVEWASVEAAQLTRQNAELVELEIDTIHGVKTIRCTPDHPVYTKNRGYVRADELNEDDDLVVMNEDSVISGKMMSRIVSSNEDTYDIQTTTHNFFANDVLVHNSEIILRSREFCNLTEVVVREYDTLETLKKKIVEATILGVFQSTLTNFKYLSKKWKENCEEERLLGVSLTGVMDNALTNGRAGNLEKTLTILRETAVATAKEWAAKIGINVSAAITCLKPSGTVSQLVDAASGIHARHSPYYIRTVRADKKDPLAKMMVDAGFIVEDDVTKPDHTYVFSFPMKSPNNSIFREDMSAIEQLELWLVYQRHFCEHKPSITVSVKENEWPEVGAWVWKHLDEMSGVSFLPFSDTSYRQMPYQDCSKEEYEAILARMPKNVDWSKLAQYENADMTVGSQELACTSSSGCEIV
jgi:ribonucleoside-diphosphate reductase alpha chain